MGILTKCPSCGLDSADIRCPRCNALKVVGCTGACTLCKSKCEATPVADAPSASAADDAEHPGTPLER